MNLSKNFPKILLQWHRQHPRPLPWKETQDPYKIWLSEIIMQQTRVEQGLPYYEKMIRLFPTVSDLAHAKEDDVLKAWQGLGYYSRARNLHETARRIADEMNGIFPAEYEQIRKLKGVGEYTAAAIASFAFGLPHAVVDGNVFRVLSRVFGVKQVIDSAAGKKYFKKLAGTLLDRIHPAEYNQALMNFGAMVCTPVPQCDACCFKATCFAFNHQAIDQLPVKKKKPAVRLRWFSFFVLEHLHHVAIEKRMHNDIWKGLFQFPCEESITPLTADAALKSFSFHHKLSPLPEITGVSEWMTHKLTHQTIMAQFIRLKLKEQEEGQPASWQWVKNSSLNNFAFPQLILHYLKKHVH